MKFTPWMVILSLGLVAACSGSKSAQKVSEETPQIELSDADEFIENPAEESMDPIVADETIEEAPMAETPVNEEPVSFVTETNNWDAGSTKQYTVQKNETLMLIAFKIYGDYEKWKELANTNKEALRGSTNIKEGMVLNYLAPAEEFVWNPLGSPYLIRTGDTLGGISKTVYNTARRWQLLWDNNRPLIKDPNKIFAGFTIYYPENGREVATEI